MMAIFKVCMCTLGASVYSRNASQPLSLFTGYSSPAWRSLYNRLGLACRRVSVDLVEEQSDCLRHRAGTRTVGHVEPVTRAGELDVTDRCGRGGFETVDEASCLV